MMLFNILSSFKKTTELDFKPQKTIDEYEEAIMGITGLKLERDYKSYRVLLPKSKGHIHTIEAGFGNKEVLVLVHGYGMSAPFYNQMIELLCKDFHIYSIDLYGMGRSSKPKKTDFSFDGVVNFFVEPMEEWRQVLKLENFILLGHSIGAYIVSQYFKLKRPPLKLLYLMSPAGFTHKTDEEIAKGNIPNAQGKQVAPPNALLNFFRYVFDFLSRSATTPYHYLIFGKKESLLGYYQSPRLKLRPEDAELYASYMSLCLNNGISGEKALGILLRYPRYSTRPISDFLSEMKERKELKTPIKIFFGDVDWMDTEHAVQVNKELGLDLEIDIIRDCGHQMLFENPAGVCKYILNDKQRGFDQIASGTIR